MRRRFFSTLLGPARVLLDAVPRSHRHARMPTYTYQCASCSHRYDAFQSMTAAPDTKCPECGGPVERLIGAGAGIVFKGSGFYVTDYRKPAPGADSSKPAESSKGEKGATTAPASTSGGAASSSSTGSSGGSTGGGSSSGSGGSSAS